MRRKMNNSGQFSIIAALFVTVILISTVMVTYSNIRYPTNQSDPQILSAIDETNLALKQVLGFTVGYYGSVLQVTGNSSYAKTLASNYLSSGLENIANIRPEWGSSFEILDFTLNTNWFTNQSYSRGLLTLNYSLSGLGVSGITYSASSRLDVDIFPSAEPNQVCLTVSKDDSLPISDLVLENFKFYLYRYSNLTWQMVNPENEPVSFSNGTYLIDVPPGINPQSYSIQVQDTRGIMVAASSFSHYTGTLTFNSTYSDDNRYVNNSNSNVDGIPGFGTHSNFAAQQSAPDGNYDTLTKANSGNQQQDYYPNSYTPIGGAILSSGALSDLQSDNSAYMTFNSYPSAYSGSSTFGYSNVGGSSQSIENTILGSQFNLASGGVAQSISAYVGAPSTQTFGDTTPDSSTASIENTIRGGVFSPTYDGVATNVRAYIGCSNTAKNMKAAIYNGATNNLIAETNEVLVNPATDWVTFTFPSGPSLTAGSNYILAVWSASGSGSANLYSQNGGSSGRSLSITYGSWPASPSFTTDNQRYNIYCTYQPTANVKAAIYTSAHTLVASTQENTVSSTGWRTFTFSDPKPILAPSTNYILAVWSNSAGGFTMNYHSGAANQGHSNSRAYGSWPANPSFGHDNREYSVYCSYSVPSEFTCTVEFTGTSNTNNWNSIIWALDSLTNTANVATTFQLYNYQTGQYPVSGDGYVTATLGTSLSSNGQTIASNPAYFRDVLGAWKLKFTAVKSTSSQFSVSVDLARFRTLSTLYTLDLEEQWLNLNLTTLEHPVLCIKTGALSAENLAVYAWHGGSWRLITAALVTGWNNLSISSYVDTPLVNFTVRFASSGSLAQSNWQIDTALLRQESDQELFLSLQDAVSTVELLQNGTMRWLGQNLQLTSETIPIPPVPVKALHINETTDGVNEEVSFQVEDWASEYTVPLGLTDNATVFGSRQMIVFLLNTHVSKFTLWWNGSDEAVQTPLAFTNQYFTDNPSGGTLSNGNLSLSFGGGFTITSTAVGTGTTSTSTFMRINNQASTYGAGVAYVVHHGVVRDIVQQEAEWNNGPPNCPNLYANIVLTLPANATYYTYQLRLMFIPSTQPRTITDLCPIKLATSINQILTENGTVLSDPIVVTDAGTTLYSNNPAGTMHHWSQFTSGTSGAGIMFTDSANLQLYGFDSLAGGLTGALGTDTAARTIQLLPITLRQVQFQTALDITWHGAVATFDGTTPIYGGSGQPGMWILAELPPSIAVATEN
jgi:hypothetical protein